MLLRLAIAAALGGIVGYDRERRDQAAGVRSHALVSLGSALFMLVSIFGFGDFGSEEGTRLDPSRVAAQVASGVGFLGAGAIIRRQGMGVQGLTTAPTIWVVAALGLAVGGGLYAASIAIVLIATVILVVLRPLTKRFRKEATIYGLDLLIVESEASIATLQDPLREAGATARRLQGLPAPEPDQQRFRLALEQAHNIDWGQLADTLRRLPGVLELEIGPDPTENDEE